MTTRYCADFLLVVKSEWRTTCWYINFMRALVNNLITHLQIFFLSDSKKKFITQA
jgi:hypothetical protein